MPAAVYEPPSRNGRNPLNDESSFDLTEGQEAAVTLTFCANIDAAVAGAAQRNALCIEWDDQLKGRYQPLQLTRWRNSCELNTPLTRELFTMLDSMLMQAVKREPKVLVESFDPASDQAARKLEDFLNNLSQKYRLNRLLGHVAYNVLRDDVSILYAGWKQHYTHTERTKYRPLRGRNADRALPIDDEERLQDQDYEEVRLLEPTVEREGCDFRPVELTDFFLYPANAASIHEHEPRGAIGCGERLWLSENQLIDGIKDFGYDEDVVQQLLDLGPTDFAGIDGDEARNRRDSYQGVTGDTYGPQDGYWECFLWFQRLPTLSRWRGLDAQPDEDEDEIPWEYRRRDAMIVCCPAHHLVLKMVLSPYSQRPYIPFYILPEPNSFLGTGLCQMLEQMQEEDNTCVRQDIDSSDIRASNMYICPDEQFEELRKLGPIGPGMFIPEVVPNSIRPLPAPAYVPMFQRSEWLRSRAQGLVSAQGYGQLDQKVRKASEVQATIGAADAKFELYLSNFQEGIADLFAWIAALHAVFGGEATFRDSFGRRATITQKDMEGQFAFIPAGTSTTANPDARYKLGQAQAGEQTRFISLSAQAPPEFKPLLWHASRQILLDLGVRRPEEYIGPEPQPPPPGMFALPELVASMQHAQLPPAVQQTILSNLQATQAQGQMMAGAANAVLTPGAPPGGVA